MTSDQERELRAELLLEYEQKSAQLKLLEGKVRDSGKRLFGLGARVE
jgi:hypothetical protein